MQDPHVETVSYAARESSTNKFQDGDPVVDEQEAFRVSLTKQGEGIIATFQMKEHFATEEAARTMTDRYIRALEVKAALVEYGGRQVLHFGDSGAEMVDRSPPPAPPPVNGEQLLAGTASSRSSGSAELTQTPPPPRPLPSPPGAFKCTPDVETLFNRYQQYVNGREPLPAMAYFCLTVVEAYAGIAAGAKGDLRKRASSKYYIAFDVLEQLDTITSEGGGPLEARKQDKVKPLSPLAEDERSWVIAVIQRIILRVGEHDYDPQQELLELKMADFPTLLKRRLTWSDKNRERDLNR